MKSLFKTIALLACALPAVSMATVTLQFSNGGIGATNFANAAGTVTNGMSWGIIVDTTGNGFSAATTNSVDSITSVTAAQVLSSNSVATDDYFIPSGLLTQTIGAPFFSGSEAGSGAITSISSVPMGSVAGLSIDQNDKFAIVWFDSNSGASGAKYGFFTSGTFVLPADGSTTPFTSAFSGSDPVRSATLTFGAASVPEPSRALLLGFGAVGLMFRRRRA